MSSSFLAACEAGNFDKIRVILETNTININQIINVKDANGWNCLHWAAWHSDIEWIEYLLTMKELDINARTNHGKTAFHIALLQPRHVDRHHSTRESLLCVEILKMLLEVNNGFVNCRYSHLEWLDYPLEYAVEFLHIDVVKLLIHFGGIGGENGYSLLHMAANVRRVDCIHYLVFEMNYDPCIRCNDGIEAWYVFVLSVIAHGPSREEIDLSLNLLSHIFDSPAESVEVCAVLLDCFHRRDHGSAMFMAIVELLLPLHRRKYFVEKILDAQLPSDYCLITLTLFQMVGKSPDFLDVAMTGENSPNLHLLTLKELKSHFLYELFHLFLADESFFNEYIEQVIRMGWTFNESDLLSTFCASLTEYKEISSQKLFYFMKSLIMHKFKFVLFAQPLPSLLPSRLGDHLLNVFVPLSNFVHAPIDLMWIFRLKKTKCHYNFNESENCVNDYNILVERKHSRSEVVSLMNLSRMSIRKYVFQNYTHYNALSMIYSLKIPMTLKMFLCYNNLNLKF